MESFKSNDVLFTYFRYSYLEELVAKTQLDFANDSILSSPNLY